MSTRAIKKVIKKDDLKELEKKLQGSKLTEETGEISEDEDEPSFAPKNKFNIVTKHFYFRNNTKKLV